jgi:glycosyltransferase involved in cell wall biosynthesis
MKVLFLTTSYPTPEAPAAGIFVEEHARAAAAHAEVAVLHLRRSSGFGVVRDPRADLPTWRSRYPERPLPLTLTGHLAAAALGYRAVRRSGFLPDVIHAHFFLAGVPAVLTRRPVVITEPWSIFLPEDPLRLSPLLRSAARFAYARAELVLPVSEALRRWIEAEGLRGRFRVVPNVVDTELFRLDGRRPGGPPRLVAVGLLYEAKGYEFLLQAIARLDRELLLDIAGDGPQRAELEALAARLGIADRVSFRGLVPKPEVAALLRDSDAFVLTSRYDNNPCAVVEALACGLPVVATSVGGVPELVDETNGLLARPQDPDSIAQRLDELLDGLDRYDRAAIAGAAQARFGHEVVGRELARAYEDAIALHG